MPCVDAGSETSHVADVTTDTQPEAGVDATADISDAPEATVPPDAEPTGYTLTLRFRPPPASDGAGNRVENVRLAYRTPQAERLQAENFLPMIPRVGAAGRYDEVTTRVTIIGDELIANVNWSALLPSDGRFYPWFFTRRTDTYTFLLLGELSVTDEERGRRWVGYPVPIEGEADLLIRFVPEPRCRRGYQENGGLCLVARAP